MGYADTTRLDWRNVAQDLLDALASSIELPADLGELCGEQRSRDTIRLLLAPTPSMGYTVPQDTRIPDNKENRSADHH